MSAGTRVYGIVAAQNFDSTGEKIDLNGLSDNLAFQRDEHSDEKAKAFEIIGIIDGSKKIFKESDCESPQQRRCWDLAKVPFLFGTGVLFDGEGHPNATSAAAILKYCNINGGDLKPGWSVDGSILERKNDAGQIVKDGKHLTKTVAVSAAFTISPANPICRGALFVDGDLQKSRNVKIPDNYLDLLHKSQSKQSFNNIISKEEMMLFSLKKLNKSIENYNNGFTTLKCWQCNNSGRFFKSMSDLPNSCKKCGKHFSVKQIWEALNK
jgi:ribosomal protein S27E